MAASHGKQQALAACQQRTEAKEREAASAAAGRDSFKESADITWNAVEKLRSDHGSITNKVAAMEGALSGEPSEAAMDALSVILRDVRLATDRLQAAIAQIQEADRECQDLEARSGDVERRNEEARAALAAQEQALQALHHLMALQDQPLGDDDLQLESSQQDHITASLLPEVNPMLLAGQRAATERLEREQALFVECTVQQQQQRRKNQEEQHLNQRKNATYVHSLLPYH